MDNPNREIQQQQQHSPGFFYVFWVLCVRQVCGHLRGRCQCLLFFGTAAGLEKPGINNHLSKPTLVDNPTAHLLSKKLKGEKLLKQCLIFFFRFEKDINFFFFSVVNEQLAFSSRNGPRRRRQRELSVFAWTLCLSHHLTGCCNWETGQETRWRSCCVHQSLLRKREYIKYYHIYICLVRFC